MVIQTRDREEVLYLPLKYNREGDGGGGRGLRRGGATRSVPT